MAVPMANDPPFATLNHFAADLGIPNESDLLRIGIIQTICGGHGRLGIVLLHMLGQDRHQLLARPIARLALLFDVHGRFLRRLAINAISDLLDCPALTLKRCIDKFLGC